MRNHHEHQMELLAPAGGEESLRAAVANGADAVYLGIDRLNARRKAANFTIETLSQACRFAHLRGVRVYLTLNVVILPAEMPEALRIVDEAWVAGVDAVIVQDLGLLRCIRSSLPHVRVHASTQMNAHSSSTVRALGARGVARVTLAREVSIPRIEALVRAGAQVGAEVETFVHGAICVCYSGQCLLSSLIGGRSANRGQCAQPCRLTYDLVDSDGVSHADVGAHLLSPKDLAGISVLPDLIATGVAAVKIEGRMKSSEYVALVTGVYRSALDRAVRTPETFEATPSDLAVLAEAFSRGLGEAYLVGERGNAMMSYRRPNNRGVAIGRIVALDRAAATVALDSSLESADTIQVWTSRGHFTQEAGMLRVGGRGEPYAPAGERVGIELKGLAAVGDRVFRVRNAALSAAAARTFSDPTAVAPVTVSFEVRVVIDEPTSVVVRDAAGRRGRAVGAIVEAARTRSVSAEEVIEHVGRVGGSGFSSDTYDVALSPGAGIGFSELHRLRRAALEDLESAILAPWAGRTVHDVREPKVPGSARSTGSVVRLVAVVRDRDAAAACLDAGADAVHLAVDSLSTQTRPGVVALLPRIATDSEEERHLRRLSAGDRVVAATLGQLDALKATGALAEAHWSLNATNAHTVAELADAGAEFVWLSPELNREQVAVVATGAPVPVGISVLGRQELMVTEHCVLMAQGECDLACHQCVRRSSPRWLEDRKKYRFPVHTDAGGRTHVFNSVPLDLLDALDDVLATGVSAVRLDLETLDATEAASEVRRARTRLDTRDRTGGDVRRSAASTAGHFYRGVD